MNRDTTFGQIVKERRNSLGLTQAELGRRVGCAAITIRKIEANDLRPSVQIAEHLAVALNIPEEEHLAFVRLARSERDPSPLPTPQPSVEEIGQIDLSGRAIRGFELGERLGTGGYGVVYRAVQSTVEREVAIKIILPQFADRPDFIRRFETEAQLVARLEHPHIVPLYDYWREPGIAYLVMRLLRGGSLETLLQDGPLASDTILRLMEQICAGLHNAHRTGIIHRDLKPANILLDDDRNAYLADFGIAKNIGPAKPAVITREGMVIGSPAYISPEQILAEPVRPQADIYSLGVLLYELLTGQKPFKGPTPYAFIQQHLNEPLPLLAEVKDQTSKVSETFEVSTSQPHSTLPQSAAPAQPTALDVVIGRATAKEPHDRYPDILSMLEDLKRALEPGSTPADLAESLAADKTPPHVAAMLELPDLENPYKGLRPFTEADAADFFGREMLVQDLLARLGEVSDPATAGSVAGRDLARFLAVVGPSGSGKSSVVRAGLIPALRQGGLPGSENWFIVEMLPGSHPFEELAAALLRVAIDPPQNLAARLRQDERGLLRTVRRILPRDEGTELLLVIDQFEEIFTLVVEEAVRTHFLDSLVTAILEPDSPLRVVITLRADFTHHPLQYVDFGELLRQRTEFVLPLTPDELEQAITGPTRRAGLKLETELVPAIIREIGDQPGTLPLLQYALTELFERRQGRLLTMTAYDESGGVTGALARRADELYEGLDDPGRTAARQLFSRLVTLGEGVEDTRRRVLRTELTAIQPSPNPSHREGNLTSPPLGGTEGGLNAVINQFGHYRLLTFDHDPVTRSPTVEVAHEALLREWVRLRRWLDQDREFLLWQQRLRAGLHQWETNEQDEGALLRGAPLAEAENWFTQRQVDLNEAEQAFIQASLDLRDRREAEREQARQARERLRRRITWGLAGGLVIAVVLMLVAGWQWRQATQERQTALDAQATAAAERDQAQSSVSRQLAVQALTQRETQLDLALLLSVEAANTADTMEVRRALLTTLETNPRLTTYLRDHTDAIRSVAFSPDGQILASGSNDTTIILWDAATGQPLGPPLSGHTDVVRSVAFSPDGQTLASGSFDGTILLWDVATGQQLRPTQGRLTGHTDAVWSVAFSPDGKTLASASADHTIILWNVSTGEPLSEPLRGHQAAVTAVAFSPDGQTLASGSIDNYLILWDTARAQPLSSPLTGHSDAVRSVAYSPDGQILASGGDQTVVLWDVGSGQRLGSPLSGHTEAVWSVAFSPDGQTLASSAVDGSIILWDVTTRQVLDSLSGHMDAVWSVAFSADGHTLASGSSDQTVILWNLDPPHPLIRTRLTGHTAAVNSVAFSPATFEAGTSSIDAGGQTMASGSSDTTIILWDVASRQPLGSPLTGHKGEVMSVAYSPDGETLASGSADKTIILWDVATRQSLGPPLSDHQGGVTSVAFSPDGQILATGGLDNRIILWDMTTRQPVGPPLTGHTAGVRSVAFSPDGQTLASGSEDQTIILWDVTTRQPLGPSLTGHIVAVFGLAFSPDGQMLASGGGFEDTFILWNVAGVRASSDGQAFSLYRISDTDDVRSVAYSPDGQVVALGSWFNTVTLWDMAGGQPLGPSLTGHSDVVTSVAYSPDGGLLASASDDHSIMLWDTSLESWQARACQRTNRNLTQSEWQQFFGRQPYRATCPGLPGPEE